MSILKVITISILFAFIGTSFANEKSDNAIRIYNSGNRNQALRIFAEILQEDPDNAEAIWQLVFTAYITEGGSITKYAKQIDRASELAIASGDPALGYYIKSRLASELNQYQLSLNEIDKAIALEPTSVRYLRTKLIFLFTKASELRSHDLVLEALAVGNKALKAIANDPKKYYTKGAIHFEIGTRLPGFNSEFREIGVNHFQKVLVAGDTNEIITSYTWNNMSGALIQLGRCKEAKVAAENALSFFKYGNARSNLARAERCISEQ